MLIDPQNLTLHVNHVRSRIRSAAIAAGRDPESITLVAVTKAKTAESVRLAATAGVTDFGENYLQEAQVKMEQLADLKLKWHFIGGIQSNKTRAIAERFDWVQSVDRFGVAPDELGTLAAAIAGLPRLRLRGLMCVPPPQANAAAERAVFASLRMALEDLNAGGLKLDTLSMGMSGDFESAIAEGATLVRIGTALFGAR